MAGPITELISSFSFAAFSLDEYFAIVKPLLLFVIGIAIYALFVFKFYQFLAKRDIFRLHLEDYTKNAKGFFLKMLKAMLYILQNLIMIPLFVFFWSAILAALLILLSKNHEPQIILLTSIAIVAATRITAYYNEELSRDMAKMIPFALLGVFLIDVSYFSMESSYEVAKQVPSLWKHLLYYLVFVVALEFVLRIMNRVVRSISKKKEQPS